MPTEEYLVIKPCTLLPPGGNTSRIDMNVIPTNSPPSAVSQVRAELGVSNTNPHGTGFEYEVVPRYARVYMDNTRFTNLRGYVNDARCTIHLRYESQVVSGSDPINSFQVITTY